MPGPLPAAGRTIEGLLSSCFFVMQSYNSNVGESLPANLPLMVFSRFVFDYTVHYVVLYSARILVFNSLCSSRTFCSILRLYLLFA